MEFIDYRELIERLVRFLRTKISDPANRGTITTESFTGTGIETEFTLSNKLITCVKSVKVDGTEQKEWLDFQAVFDDPTDATSYPKIKFKKAPPSGSSIEVEYHYGETWVYQAFPSIAFVAPKVTIMHISSREEMTGHGAYVSSQERGTAEISWIDIDVWTRSGEVYEIAGEKMSGNKLKDYLADRIRLAINSNRDYLNQIGLTRIMLRMARDIDYAPETGVYRKTLSFEIVHLREL